MKLNKAEKERCLLITAITCGSLSFTFRLPEAVALCPVRSFQRAPLCMEQTETTDKSIMKQKHFPKAEHAPTSTNRTERTKALNSWQKQFQSGRPKLSFYKGSPQSGVHPVSELF